MSKRDLKQKHKDLEINVIDIVNKFDPSKTGKFTGFLVKLLKEHNEKVKKRRSEPLSISAVYYEMPKSENPIELVLIEYLHSSYGRENLQTLVEFEKHLRENRIPEDKRDINNYNSWEDMNREVSLATIKQVQKLLEKEVKITHENEEWIALRPLTVEASLTYGSGTKWCTSSRRDFEYFYRYSKNGVLTYVINKINGDKYGLYYDKDIEEFSIWDVIDKRVDSSQTTMPSELVKMIYVTSKTDKCNYDYFSKDEKNKAENFYREEKPVRPLVELTEMGYEEELAVAQDVIYGDEETVINLEVRDTIVDMYTSEITLDWDEYGDPHEFSE